LFRSTFCCKKGLIPTYLEFKRAFERLKGLVFREKIVAT